MMDDETIRLGLRWIGLAIAMAFFGVSVVKRHRGLSVGLFGVVLLNTGMVADRYGINSFPFSIISLVFMVLGFALMARDRQASRQKTEA